MYELEYVKKRKRRKWVAFGGGICTMVVSTFSIVAFLGRFVGTFTVSLDTGNVALTLSRDSEFKETTSFLRVDDLPTFQEYTYSSFEQVGHDVIDSEESTLEIGAASYNTDKTIKNLNFFKYTFFVKNVGDVPARYTAKINVLEMKADVNGRTLDETLRVMVYENSDQNSHEKTVYGKRSATPHDDNPDGIADYRAPISISKYDATESQPFQGYAEMFESASVITTLSVDNFEISEIRRYTLVVWLEGFRSSNLTQAPKGASIKLGVEINAYEI